jgi:hypothetical protein
VVFVLRPLVGSSITGGYGSRLHIVIETLSSKEATNSFGIFVLQSEAETYSA